MTWPISISMENMELKLTWKRPNITTVWPLFMAMQVQDTTLEWLSSWSPKTLNKPANIFWLQVGLGATSQCETLFRNANRGKMKKRVIGEMWQRNTSPMKPECRCSVQSHLTASEMASWLQTVSIFAEDWRKVGNLVWQLGTKKLPWHGNDPMLKAIVTLEHDPWHCFHNASNVSSNFTPEKSLEIWNLAHGTEITRSVASNRDSSFYCSQTSSEDVLESS